MHRYWVASVFELAMLGNIALLLGGLYYSYNGLKHFTYNAKMKKLNTSTIDSVAAGEVEIKGVAVCPDSGNLIGPLSQKKCALYRLVITQTTGSGKYKHVQTLIDEVYYDPFFLKDGTGMIYIDPADAKISCYGGLAWTGETLAKQHELLVLKKYRNVNLGVGIFDIREYPLLEGENLYVSGTTAKGPYNSAPGMQTLMLKAAQDAPLFISDQKEEVLAKENTKKMLIFGILGVVLIVYSLLSILNILDWMNYIGGITL